MVLLRVLDRLRWYERMAAVLLLGLAVRVNLPHLLWRGVVEPQTPWLFPVLGVLAVAFLCYALAWHYDRRMA